MNCKSKIIMAATLIAATCGASFAQRTKPVVPKDENKTLVISKQVLPATITSAKPLYFDAARKMKPVIVLTEQSSVKGLEINDAIWNSDAKVLVVGVINSGNTKSKESVLAVKISYIDNSWTSNSTSGSGLLLPTINIQKNSKKKVEYAKFAAVKPLEENQTALLAFDFADYKKDLKLCKPSDKNSAGEDKEVPSFDSIVNCVLNETAVITLELVKSNP